MFLAIISFVLTREKCNSYIKYEYENINKFKGLICGNANQYIYLTHINKCMLHKYYLQYNQVYV